MTSIVQPLTQLEAINICLSSMGEPAVNAVSDAGVDAQMASDLVDETSRFMQLRGWHWNRERHTLSPDSSGYINLPNNVGKIDSDYVDANIDVVQRGLRLYNRADNTYTFAKPIVLELYVILPFEDLPLSARTFIAYEAASTFQNRMLGDGEIAKKLEAKRDSAWAEVIRDDTEVSDPNMLRDNWSTMSIVQRGQFRRGAYL